MNKQTITNNTEAPARSIRSLVMTTLLPALLMLLSTSNSQAGSATWNLNPTSGAWGTAANWTPATVPNGPSDAATFASSNTTSVSISFPLNVELRQLTFEGGASAFTIVLDDANLTLDGEGIRNISGVQQNFIISYQGDEGTLFFNDGASAGSETVLSVHTQSSVVFNDASTAAEATFNNLGGSFFDDKLFFGGQVGFSATSTADRATFNNQPGGFGTDAPGGEVFFDGTSTAGHGTFNNIAATAATERGGLTEFFGSSSAGQATFHNYGATLAGTGGEGSVIFQLRVSNPTAANGTFINDGGLVSGAPGGLVIFNDSATAGDAIITNHGGATAGAGAGLVTFHNTASAGNATLINEDAAVTGAAGGIVQFFDDSSGGLARVELFGVGQLDISAHNLPGVTIGSIEGSGTVLLGANNLSVGGNDRSTIFSGLLEDGGSGGSLTKLGAGTLTLTQPNSYGGGTVVSGGILSVKSRAGSATGSGPVQVAAATLGGKGEIDGAVTVGTGAGAAILAPGVSGKAGRLTIGNALIFNSLASYAVDLNSTAVSADQVVALGVTINGGAQISIDDLGSGVLTQGTVFTVISNKGRDTDRRNVHQPGRWLDHYDRQ